MGRTNFRQSRPSEAVMMGIYQTVRAIAGGMLLAAALPLPERYYDILRFVVFFSALIEILHTFRAGLSLGTTAFWVLIFAAIAMVFNPILVLSIDRHMWIYFDVISAVMFGLVILCDWHPKPGA